MPTKEELPCPNDIEGKHVWIWVNYSHPTGDRRYRECRSCGHKTKDRLVKKYRLD